METSAEKALEIGLNVFVFIMALSGAIVLLTSVLDMSEVANNTIKSSGQNSLLALYGENEERKYLGYEILAVISEFREETNDISEDIIFYIRNTAGVEEIIDSNFNFTTSILQRTYLLEYTGPTLPDASGNIYNQYVFIEQEVL